MRTTLTKSNSIFLLTLLLLVSSLSAFGKPQENIKKKQINQSYNVSQSDKLQVDNRFGNITITHWNKNEVAIRIEIESKASSQQRAQECLDRIQIETKKEGGIVSAITTLKEKNGNTNNESMTINYYIQMPAKLASELSQKYGNINLPSDNNGKTDIHVKYGNLNAGNFIANIMIEAKYGNIEVGNLQNAQFDLGYVGNAKINNVKELKVDTKYSNLKINTAENVSMEMKYGNLTVEHINQLKMEVKYSDIKIGALKQSLSVSELSYSNLEIDNLSSSFTRLDVQSHYGNLDVRLPAKSSFKVLADDMKYGNCSVEGFKITSKNFDDDDKSYSYEINGGGQRTIYFGGNKYGNLKVRAN